MALAAFAIPAYADALQSDLSTSLTGKQVEITLSANVIGGSSQTQSVDLWVNGNNDDSWSVTGASTAASDVSASMGAVAVANDGVHHSGTIGWTAPAAQASNVTYDVVVDFTGTGGDHDLQTNGATVTIHFTVSGTGSGPADSDDDGVPDSTDNCPQVANASQANADGDSLGDACDSNSYAPAVATAAIDASGNEGGTLTASGSFTDQDGNSSLTITGSGVGTVTDNGDGTWSWSYSPVDNGTGSVTVTATDGEHTDATDSFDWTALNVAPTAAAPAFVSTSVDCRHQATLGSISFSDPGVDDDDWTVDIDWGDGSPHTFVTASTQGSVTNQTHTYNAPGSYTATVTVTDKDGGVSTTVNSSNQLTVAQTYSVDFLPPFDDSSPSGLIVNKMKNGRVVPVKATIYDDCAQAFVTDPTTQVSIKTSKTSGTGAGDPVEEYADAGQSASNGPLFRWSTDGFWIYNLDSKALGLVVGNNYRVDIYVGTVKATRDDWAVLQPVK